MSRERKTGELSIAAAIPPGVPNATSFGPGPSIVLSFFFYCTQHAHPFPVLLVAVHGVAICAATATRREERAMERARVRRILF